MSLSSEIATMAAYVIMDEIIDPLRTVLYERYHQNI
jgi:hypothetical protein